MLPACQPTFVVSRVHCDKSHARSHDCSYQVSWAINPHMRIGAVDFRAARRQHDRFCRTLEQAGAELITLPFVHGAFDSVFSKDNAILRADDKRRRAFMTTPRHGQRVPEQTARLRALEHLGFSVDAPSPHCLEGGDVVMLPSGRALLGYGPRSSQRAAGPLSRFIGHDVLPLELVDPYFYHLDTALAVLSDGTALLHAEAFTRASLDALAAHPDITRLAAVPRAEAMAFGLNMVEVGRTVVLGGSAPSIEATLAHCGWTPVIAPLGQFHLSGGSAACLTAKIHM